MKNKKTTEENVSFNVSFNDKTFTRFVIVEKTKKFRTKVNETIHSIRMSLGF